MKPRAREDVFFRRRRLLSEGSGAVRNLRRESFSIFGVGSDLPGSNRRRQKERPVTYLITQAVDGSYQQLGEHWE